METIHVTQDHIDRGKKGDALFCPIAIAMNDQLLDCYEEDLYVGGQYVGKLAPKRCFQVRRHDIRFLCNEGWNTRRFPVMSLTEEQMKFMKAFDAGLPVAPLSFEVEFEMPITPIVGRNSPNNEDF